MESIIIEIKVIPKSKLNQVDNFEEIKSGCYKMKLRVSAPPTDGKANDAVIKLLADFLDVTKSQVSIVSGWTSRQKKVQISNFDKNKMQGILQLSLC